MKENLHRDYIPKKVINYTKSSIVCGVIIKLRLQKTKNLSFLYKILFFIPKYKDVYFWLPYKRIVEISSKYGVVGPASRFPYAMQWFEVKHNSEIYKQGLNNFVFHRKRIYKATNELRQSTPFLANELLILTRKSVIKILDNHVFNVTKRQRKK